MTNLFLIGFSLLSLMAFCIFNANCILQIIKPEYKLLIDKETQYRNYQISNKGQTLSALKYGELE